ncbi:MAG: hypothetical protein V3571_04110 [Pseudodesulfovibrio sp.]
MIHTHTFQGVTVRTGDLLATRDGTPRLSGQFWRIVGGLIPGEVEHIVVYVGLGPRCVEAGAKGKVLAFEARDDWDGEAMQGDRGFIDTLHGAAYPLAGKDVPPEKETRIRETVAAYCLHQAAEEKPYNLNFMNPDTEEAFYCSQLAYRAYLPHGVNLNAGRGLPNFGLTRRIVFPQEVWDLCEHTRVP